MIVALPSFEIFAASSRKSLDTLFGWMEIFSLRGAVRGRSVLSENFVGTAAYFGRSKSEQLCQVVAVAKMVSLKPLTTKGSSLGCAAR